VKGKTNRGLLPLQKFQFHRNHLISWIKIKEEGKDFFRIFVNFFFPWHLPDHCVLRAPVTREQGYVRERSGGG